ncbi:MAG: SNF2 family DNA or RNA helicase [Planctomycetota bacterium]|jgi:SNF2 family DNA or RNA helicase
MHPVLQELAGALPDRFRQQGALHFRRGDVLRLKGGGESWTAVVRGSGEFYDVSIENVLSEKPTLDCSCPATRHYDFCKHVWAVLLSVDEKLGSKGATPMPRGQSWHTLMENAADAKPPIRRPTQSSRQRLFFVVGPSNESWISQYEVKVLTQEMGHEGDWNPRREYRPGDFDRASDQDRKVLTILQGGALWGTQRHWRTETSVFDMDLPELESIFADLIETERTWFGEEQINSSDPLSIDPGEPFTLRIALTKNGKPSFAAHFVRGTEEIPTSKVQNLLPNGHFRVNDDTMLRKFTPKSAHDAIERLLKSKDISLTTKEVDECFVALQGTSLATSVLAPDGWTTEAPSEDSPKPILNVKRTEWQRLKATVSYKYDDDVVNPAENHALVNVPERKVTQRDFDKENQLLEEIGKIDCVDEVNKNHEVWFQANNLPRLVKSFYLRDWTVRVNNIDQQASDGTEAQVSSSKDWFDLQGGLNFGGQVLPFPTLLAALKKGAKSVILEDGTEGVLPEEWLGRKSLLELGELTADDSLRFTNAQGLFLDMLLDDAETVNLDARFTKWRNELRTFKGAAPAKEPRGFQGELREYQKEGVGWMKFLRRFGFGGCLADDMGLGKTVQVLADIQTRKLAKATKGPTLVVAPRSVVHNWITEAKKFAPKLKILDFGGPDRDQLKDAIASADLVVTTYGIIRRDILDLKEIDFRCIVLDEAQAIKNEKSQTAKACLLLQGTDRLALSGTPIENRIEELWSIFEFLNPGMLGAVKSFRELTGNDPESRSKLGRALSPFIMRRTKEEVATDLPEKSESILECELGPKQRQLYDELRMHYRSALDKSIDTVGFEKSKFQVLEALLRLRQAACHPGLIDDSRADEEAAKLELLMDRLTEVVDEGHKALVFSQFTKHLGLVKKKLEAAGMAYEYLDGATRNRGEKIERFQTDEECPVFLISLKAGGTGLNLTAADYVFMLDPWWNPAAEAQAIDRTHRIGQTRQVFAYRLIARDTIEEKIVAMQQEKRELASSILDGSTKTLKDLTASDLRFLLE